MIVPDKFNMVDMEGIDLLEVQGIPVEGLYDKLVESIALCRYQCLYNWKFNDILIPPTYVEMEVGENEEVIVNFGITVTPDDVIHLQTIEPGPSEPIIIPLLAEENMVYNVPAGVDGFGPVTVEVPSYTPEIEPLNVSANGTYNAPAGVDGFNPVIVNVSSGPITYIGHEPPPSSLGTDGDWYIFSLLSCRINSLGFNTGVNGNSVYGFEYIFTPLSSINTYQSYLLSVLDNFTVGQAGSLGKVYLRIASNEKFSYTFPDEVNIKAKYGSVVAPPAPANTYATNNPICSSSGNIIIGANVSNRFSDFVFESLILYDSSWNVIDSFYYDENSNTIKGSTGSLVQEGTGSISLYGQTSINIPYHKENGVWVKY